MQYLADETGEGIALTHQAIAGISLLFTLVFLRGFWLTRSGKPYNGLVLMGHKLIALAALIILAMTVFRVARQVGLDTTAWIACACLTTGQSSIDAVTRNESGVTIARGTASDGNGLAVSLLHRSTR